MKKIGFAYVAYAKTILSQNLLEGKYRIRRAAILILESSLKTARQRRAVFRLQSREFAPFGRELSALRVAGWRYEMERETMVSRSISYLHPATPELLSEGQQFSR